MGNWVTSALILLPAGAALAIWLLPWPRVAAGVIALVVSAAEVGLWIAAVADFDFSQASSALQYEEQATWFGELGISYHVGFLGIGLWLTGLTVVCQTAAIAYAMRAGRERPRAYFGLMLLLTGAIVGVFCAQDLLLFYVFWEAMLIPLYLLVGVWGGEGRQRATLLFVIYTMAGSLLMLAAIVVFGLSEGTFDLAAGAPLGLRGTGDSDWLFLGFVLAFAVKAPLFPFHGWLPSAYREAPAEVAGVLSGVVSKAAAYGFLYIAIVLFPGPAADFRVAILALAAVGLVYGSLLAFRAADVRGVIAYSSLAQLALILLGVFATNIAGWNGALLQMVNHGLLSLTLFLLAGLVESRAGTGRFDRLGGMARGRPALATVLMVTGIIALAVPGSTAFAGEFLILTGVFDTGWGWAVVGAIAIVLAAMYMLRLISAVLHEREGTPVAKEARDLRLVELAVLVPLVACLLALSAWPAAVTDHSFGQTPSTPGLGNLLEPFE
jgi:NADH-quinone oxidoreductase subunit M